MAELDLASDWRTLRCQLDDGPAPRAAIGLIALASDSVIEPELRRFLPTLGSAPILEVSQRLAISVAPESLPGLCR